MEQTPAQARLEEYRAYWTNEAFDDPWYRTAFIADRVDEFMTFLEDRADNITEIPAGWRG